MYSATPLQAVGTPFAAGLRDVCCIYISEGKNKTNERPFTLGRSRILSNAVFASWVYVFVFFLDGQRRDTEAWITQLGS